MRDVQMAKKDLRKRLLANKKVHRAQFEAALAAWKQKVVETLEDRCEKAKNGKEWNIVFHLPQPQDHTEDYEQALLMLEHEERDSIILTNQEYAQFVMDNWGWKQQFTTTNSMYVAG